MENENSEAGDYAEASIDFDETSAQLQSGLDQCHRVVASYRQKLVGFDLPGDEGSGL